MFRFVRSCLRPKPLSVLKANPSLALRAAGGLTSPTFSTSEKPDFSGSSGASSHASWPQALGYLFVTGTSAFLILKYTWEAFDFPTGMLNEQPPVPAHCHWPNNGNLQAYDHASLRRGYQVYREVCSQCHSLKGIAFRHLVGVTHTEEQAKALAAATPVPAAPNDEGDVLPRPAILLDSMPNPYKNDEFARAVNGGALPPDLTKAAIQNHHRADYVFALLTGYNDAPAGIAPQEGKHWNTYFDGGWVSMPPPLIVDEMVEYEDGTIASKSQMAKDVTHFLTWASDQNHDDRKRQGILYVSSMFALLVMSGIWKRYKFLPLKNELSYWKS